MKKRLSLVALALAVLVQSGCGYSLAGRGSFLPAYIKRIGIPLFTNSTTVFDLDRKVTDKVRSEFIGRGKWTVVPDQTGVDGVLVGTITGVSLTPVAFNNQQQATRYALAMTGSVEFKDLQTNKVLWSNPSMAYREEFDVPSSRDTLDVTTYFGQDTNALDRLTSEFSRALVSALLEAF
jgi:Lipopolysaccharide-assembly